MKNLDEIRKKINETDAVLKNSFLERMNLVEQVYMYKKANNLPVKNKGREAEIIKNKTSDIGKFKDETAEFFKSMIEISCNYQDEMLSVPVKITEFSKYNTAEFDSKVKNVCYQGIKGSYSYEAASERFGGKNIFSVNSFADVFDSVEKGDADVGVLPIENLCAGSIYDVYDLLSDHDVYISDCLLINIDHCLAGTGRLSDVKNVVSHRKALEQCKRFIESNKYKTSESINTAVAAQKAAEAKDPASAVVCSKAAAEIYGLNILDDDICDISHNKTKFVFISKKPVMLENANAVSILFELQHESGSLARVLNNFSKHNINLTKIESRPTPNDEWKYRFFVDLEMPGFDVGAYFAKIRYMFDGFKVLGIYNNCREEGI